MEFSELRKTMYELMKQSKHAEIVDITKKMISIDYTDMETHKILQQTYKIMGDASNQEKYRNIEFGLLNSIIKSGNVQTCQTAWPVIQAREEYFILSVIGMKKLIQQSVDRYGGVCDKMEVQTDEGPKIYYFGISKVFKGYNKLGIY